MKKTLLFALLFLSSIFAQNNLFTSEYFTKGNLSSVSSADEIGVPGTVGFGVGFCDPANLPSGIQPNVGYSNPTSDNYGNYTVTVDGSQMVYIPAFAYKIFHDGSTNINRVYIYSMKHYGFDTTRARVDGYVVHRAFIDGGVVKKGVFVDKYKWSLTGFVYNTSGIASSIKNGNPISSAATTVRDGSNLYAGAFTNCKSNSQSPANVYGGAWSAAKSRGSDYSVPSIFIYNALSLLSLAHGQAAIATTYCAWYDGTGVTNFPKGQNNYSADINDATVTFTACTDGYWSGQNAARKVGSGSNFAKTTHNGQNCGIADLNGCQYEIMQGITSGSIVSKNITAITRATQAKVVITSHGWTTGQQIQIQGTSTTEWNNLIQNNFYTVTVISADTVKLTKNYDGSYVNSSALSADYSGTGLTAITGLWYVMKESVSLKNVTGSNVSTTTDHFNSTYITNNFDAVPFSNRDGGYAFRYGNSTNQVLGFSTNRTSSIYKMANSSIAMNSMSVSSAGTNQFGQDYYYQWIRSELCALHGGDWYDGTTAGVWYVYWGDARYSSYYLVSGRSCLFSN